MNQSHLRQLISGHEWRAVWALLLYLAKHSPAPVTPVITAWMIDLAIMGGDGRLLRLGTYGGVLILLWVLNVPLHTIYFQQLSRITRSIGRDLRVRICRQLQRLSLLYHYRTSIGKLHSKAIRDIELIEQTPFIFCEVMFSFIVNVSVAVVAILWRAPAALIFFFIAVLVAGLIRHIFYERMNERVEAFRQSVEMMSGSLNEMLRMIPVTRSHGMENREIELMEDKIKRVYSRGREFDFIRAVFGSSGAASMSILQVLVLIGAIHAAMQTWITVGDVVMFNSFFIGLSSQLANVMNVFPQISQGRESVRSVFEIIDAPNVEVNEGKPAFEEVRGSFVFEGVSFRYPDAREWALVDFDLKVEAGESIAFVGPSGAGKSTVLSLVLGLVLPARGRVLVDGKDLAEMDLRTLRRHVGVVSQETLLFSGSLFDNVAFGLNEAREAEVWDALDKAGARKFAGELPDGLHTRLGEDGVELSGGQRQRISIARAIIRNPRILILDEATSALDHESEKAVQDSLDRLMQGRTTFIVSHRISATRRADRIVILENGRIAAVGSPEALVERDNFYARAARG